MNAATPAVTCVDDILMNLDVKIVLNCAICTTEKSLFGEDARILQKGCATLE